MNKPTVALIVYEQMMPIHFAMAYSVFSMSDLNGKPLFECKIVSDSDNLTNSLHTFRWRFRVVGECRYCCDDWMA